MKPEKCPACGAPQVRVHYEHAPDYISGDVFQVWRCESCQVGFTVPLPDNLEPYYPTRYRHYNRAVLAVLETIYRLRARAWSRSFDRPGTALEIGCGDGFMLDALRREGWRVVGTERTAHMASFARRELGLSVFAGGLEALAPCPLFDLIVLFQVLEHLPNPVTTLRQCACLLNPGGRLIIGVPNFSSWQARVGGPLWFHLDVPRHLFHFSPASLSRLLAEAGLRVDRVRFVSFEHDPYGWIQTFLNGAGIRHNALTRLLMKLDPISTRSIGGLAAGFLLALPAFILAVVSWLCGRGALIQVEAGRPQ